MSRGARCWAFCDLSLGRASFSRVVRENVELSPFWKGRENFLHDNSAMGDFIKKLPLFFLKRG